ncbi:hypothetical protein [Sphingomonas sp. 2R-10]|uniref:hypothetical protein n=1 Tax=Sphingomonas sp. 2R-10 TaxID=3045148 RepID=UPI000F7ACEA1|nr:hypothetical protein [Sphingomonas sp. 2R-10]
MFIVELLEHFQTTRSKSMIRHLLVMSPMLLATPAAAQVPMVDVPIWSNGLLGQSAMSLAVRETERRNGVRSDRRRSASRECSADALPIAERRRMEAEYVRRARADGRASADAWVNEQGRRFRMKLIADGVCDDTRVARAERTERPAAGKARKQVTDRNGRPCSRTRLEMRTTANLSGGAMSMSPVPVCAD